MKPNILLATIAFTTIHIALNHGLSAQDADTLPPVVNGVAPSNFAEMWAGFDPKAEPLETETLQEWQEDGVTLRIVRFRIGVFKGTKAILAGVYGFPTQRGNDIEKIPGLLQIHGGGQYADHKACLANAKLGYATVSIAWAGRISAPNYRITPTEVQLFWDGKTNDPAYKLTTDWGAVDGYHAPGRNPGNSFPDARPADWTLDPVESPRNSGWFLCALAARRALTFLEQQPEVDPSRLGVYGHSMGGKLTVMTAVDSRVKAAAPSCGGISDRDNASPLFKTTLGDNVSLRQVSCPIIFLSPSNDFHGRIGDLPNAIGEVNSSQWRVTSSPHLNHQDTAEYEVNTMLWFNQHLQHTFEFPQTPKTELSLNTADHIPTFTVQPDTGQTILSVNIFYTQNGKANETPQDREDTMHRFWRNATAVNKNGIWTAKLPVSTTDKPLWVYANIAYPLEKPVTGAGYYYGQYVAESFNISSLLKTATPEQLKTSEVAATLQPSLMISDFSGDWQKEWFTLNPKEWARTTHKFSDDACKAPDNAMLALQVKAEQANVLVVLLGDYGAEVQLQADSNWQSIVLSPEDFKDATGKSRQNWNNIRQLKLSPAEHLHPKRGEKAELRLIGAHWNGQPPTFRNLRWQVTPIR